MAELAVRVAGALDLDVVGIDILFDTDGYRICEANSSPGFQALEPACGINVPEIVFAAVSERLESKKAPRRSRLRLLDALWGSRARRKPAPNRGETLAGYGIFDPAK